MVRYDVAVFVLVTVNVRVWVDVLNSMQWHPSLICVVFRSLIGERDRGLDRT